MKNTLLIASAVIGFVIAVVNAAIRKFSWRRDPELAAFVEILLSSMGVSAALKVANLAISLPETQATDEDKVYFCLGAVALTWVSVATIIRKFKRPADVSPPAER